MELKILIKNTYHLASVRLVRFIIGIIRAKFNAIFLGKTGIGIVSQILFINGRFKQFALLGMDSGLVKQLASRKGRKNFRQELLNSLKSYFIIIALTTLIIIGGSLLFSRKLTVYFFGDIKFYKYYLISIVCLPIMMINSVSFALLQTFKLISKMARAELISAIMTFVIFIPMIYYFRLLGAILVIIINLIFILILNYIFSKKYVLKKYSITFSKVIAKGNIISADMKELIMFGGFGLTLGVYQMFVIMVRRAVLVNELGIISLGLYAPNIAWGGLFTGMMLPTIRHYLYPRFSELKEDSKIVSVLNDAFRLTTFMMVPFLFGGIAFRKIIIPLFYSIEFIEAAKYLPGHFLGMLFMMWSQIFIMVYTPTGRIKIYALFQFILQTIDLGLVFILIPRFGLYGYMLTFSIQPILFIIVSLIYLRSSIGFHLVKNTKAIFLYVLTFSFILFFITESNAYLGYMSGMLMIFTSWFFLQKSEKRQIIIKMRYFKNKLIKHN